jgi:hypothetical protein
LKYLDLSSITGLSVSVLEEIKLKKPELLMRKFRDDKVDPNDNGLRVPRRVVEAEGGKKKKKK